MKSSLAVIALIYGVQAIKFGDNELLSIGERMNLIEVKNKKFDESPVKSEEQQRQEEARSLFGQVDYDVYGEETKQILEGVPLNIRFENQSGMPEQLVYPKKEKVQQPAPVVVVQKPEPEQEEFTEAQKEAHQDFLEQKMAEYDQENSVNTEGDVTQRASKDYAEAMANKELDRIKAKDINKNNLKKLKNKKKQAMVKLQQLEKKVKLNTAQSRKELDAVWDKFCLNFKKADFDKAQSMWAKFNEQGAEFKPLEVRTNELYQKGFTLDGVSQNDVVQETLEGLNIAQDNLNMDLKNPDLMINFIKVAKKTKKELKASAFGSFWEEPKSE